MKNAVSNNTEIRIEHALFELMREREYRQIGVTDIAETAGIGRATFYRYFKRKEEVVAAYFTRNAEAFGLRNCTRRKEDYGQIVRAVLETVKAEKERFALIRQAHLEYLFFDFLNQQTVEAFKDAADGHTLYEPQLFAGAIFNVCMAWIDGGCAEPLDEVTEALIRAVNLQN